MARAAKPDALAEYHTKRRFEETPEPQGAGARAKPGHAYLIQKHDATRLHYDFRLELDGVLLSWAVTRGPSYSTSDRRLAVRTEDHPLEYGGFEGTIPKGNYGGGTVMLWDTGSWEPIGDPRAGLEKGKLVFLLHGKRLQGRWGLIRMKPREKEKRENWLLIKEKDEFANTNPDLLETATTSVISRRDLRQIAQSQDREWRTDGKKLPKFTPPMLATLVDEVPSGPDWMFEIKFDGYRAQIAADAGTVKIYTRSGLDWTGKFPAIAKAVSAMQLDGALIDGEIVVLDEKGCSDFPALVAALESGKGQLTYFAFDLLEHAGKKLNALPFTERKSALKKLLGKVKKNAVIQYSEDFSAEGKDAGAKLLQAACEQGLEGIIAKRATAPYRAGRGGAWVKIKCRQEQEFLILGFSASEKSRPFSSLLMGVNEEGGIRYAGRVGTGFDEPTLARLAALRDKHKTAKAPAANIPKEMRRNVTWVEPVLVANVAFAGWTGDKQIRQGSFLGLRQDKKPAEVVREIPKRIGSMAAEIDGVRVSHGEKIVYPDAGVSKNEIASYLHDAAKRMLPFTAGRFITLLRAPGGADRNTFYQRHPGAGFGAAWLEQKFVNRNDKIEDYIYFEKPEALVAASQMNVLEFHIWGSRIDEVQQPDRIVFDLDPDPSVDFEAVKRAAFRLRDVLEALELQSLPLLTGGKGVHVVVPIARKYEWPVIKEFSANLANRVVADAPDLYVATMSKARRTNKIFIDHFRNEIGSTAIAPYSPRARPGAPVAWPLDWAGLHKASAANGVGLRDAAAAIAAGEADGWDGYEKIKQGLKPAVLRALDVGFS
jgi:bifunctional non-homologous end joining protein LigD